MGRNFPLREAADRSLLGFHYGVIQAEGAVKGEL